MLAKSDHYVGDGRRTCRRIGRALEQAAPREWHAEANLVEIYDHLVNRLEGQNFEPLESADLPKTLRRFCKTACSLADKLNESDSVTSRAHRTAGLVARKAVSITLIIGGLAGFEQDIEPAAKDAVEFVTVIMRGLERLIHDDEFVLPLPSRDIRPPQLDLAVIILDLDAPGAVDDNGPEPDGPISSEGVDPEFDGPPAGDGLSVLDLVNDLGQLDLDDPDQPAPEVKPPSDPEPPWRDGPGGPNPLLQVLQQTTFQAVCPAQKSQKVMILIKWPLLSACGPGLVTACRHLALHICQSDSKSSRRLTRCSSSATGSGSAMLGSKSATALRASEVK